MSDSRLLPFLAGRPLRDRCQPISASTSNSCAITLRRLIGIKPRPRLTLPPEIIEKTARKYQEAFTRALPLHPVWPARSRFLLPRPSSSLFILWSPCVPLRGPALASIRADHWPGTILPLLRPLQIQPRLLQHVDRLGDQVRPVFLRSSSNLEPTTDLASRQALRSLQAVSAVEDTQVGFQSARTPIAPLLGLLWMLWMLWTTWLALILS